MYVNVSHVLFGTSLIGFIISCIVAGTADKDNKKESIWGFILSFILLFFAYVTQL